MFPTTAKTAIQNLINAAPTIDNVRCQSAHQFATTSTLNQFINFQYELVELCPKVYDSIKYLNITTWGPVEEFIQIWSMKYVDSLWKKIQTKNSATCRCVLYEDFIKAAQTSSDTTLLQYLQNNYDPSLCAINTETLYKWHLFLQKPQIKNRITKFLIVGDFSIQLVQHLAKAYLSETRYNSYFEPPTPTSEYPLLIYFDPIFTFTNYSLAQKGFIKTLRNFYKQQFPLLNLDGRQQLFSKKFCESIDLQYSYFALLNGIPLEPSDGITHYDLIIYLSRRGYLLSTRQPYITTAPAPCVITTSTTTIKTTQTTTTTKKPTTTTTTTSKPSTTTATTTTPKPTTTSTSTTTTTTVPSTTTTTIVPSTTTTTGPTPCSTPCCTCPVPLQTVDDICQQLTISPCNENNVIKYDCGLICAMSTKKGSTDPFIFRGSLPVDFTCDASGSYYIGTMSDQVKTIRCS
uniref:Uncharacterized protein n=1 Tax=Panagrolaimus davidi TaxID=227884 RepID=A0A914PX24_9BILA